jgi:hypothetical protein
MRRALALAACCAAASGGRANLPAGPLIAAYATRCTAGTLRAARDGVNVLYWFAASLTYNASDGTCGVSYGGPPLDCVASVALALRAEGLPTAHLLTFGGWDAPHPDARAAPAAAYAAWAAWNRDVVARPGLEAGFDGIDWDLEGNDNATAPENVFPVAVLDLVGAFSALAHADGLAVSMVPPESYLDVRTAPAFSRALTFTYPDGWQPQFAYHGRSAYAYLLARWPGAFDVVLLQLYETFSHLDYAVQALGTPPAAYLVDVARAMARGFDVDFASDAALNFPSARVAVEPARLLLGFGNAWVQAAPGTPANATRNTLVAPRDIGAAHAALGRDAPRGYFFCESCRRRACGRGAATR